MELKAFFRDSLNIGGDHHNPLYKIMNAGSIPVQGQGTGLQAQSCHWTLLGRPRSPRQQPPVTTYHSSKTTSIVLLIRSPIS